MNMEEFRGLNENFDSFPVGLRVLAVDDDAVCLKLLETQLRKCQYHVTTSSQARTALKMLRENKDGFDLVISDVHMPDMDGFKLLELVGLEMDVPVIMLSANDDPKLVLKGVTHGACDYLVKPVKHELLKNIWQHVIRRKKFQSKSTDESRNPHVNEEVCGSPKTTDSSGYRNRKKLSRKRKDNGEDTESDDEDDPARPSKVRVVWTADLHQKFITAVQQLGFEKAVPKKILDLMNIQGITRENVASHLQKYRIYLKKVSEEANMRATAGLDSYRTYSTDWLGDYRRRLANAALSSPYATTTANNVNLRLNSPSANNVNLLNLTPPSLLKTCSTPNPFVFQGNQNCTDNSRIFPSANAFRLNSAASKMMLNANVQQTLGGVCNPQLASHNYMTSSNPEPYNGDINCFSNSPVDGLTETNSTSTHYFPNYSPNFENGNEKPASEGFVPQSYDSMEDFMNAMLKREQDGALLNNDSGFDDCLLEKLYNEAFAMDPR